MDLFLTILQIQKTGLAYILQLGACLAYLGLLVPGIPSGPPSEYSEWSSANLKANKVSANDRKCKIDGSIFMILQKFQRSNNVQ
jgi:hypothetical protein